MVGRRGSVGHTCEGLPKVAGRVLGSLEGPFPSTLVVSLVFGSLFFRTPGLRVTILFLSVRSF